MRQLRFAPDDCDLLFERNPLPMWVFDPESLAILAVNDAAVAHYGYPREEFLRLTIRDIRPPEDAPQLIDYLQAPAARLTHDGTWRHRKSDGTLIDVEITSQPVIFDGRLAELVMAHDVTTHKRSEDTLRAIVDGLTAANGDAFFQLVARTLASALEADYTLIGEVIDDRAERIRTIAVCAHGSPVDNSEYDLAGTPCANVVGKTLCIHPSGVQQGFPDDRLLVEMGVDGYIGTPLVDSAGRAIGLMAVLSRGPLQDADKAASLLRIFSVRAAVELERIRAERALKTEKAYLEELFESTPGAVAILDDDGRVRRINRAFTRTFGFSSPEAVGRAIDDLIAPPALRDEAAALTRTVAGGGPVARETVRQRKDGAPLNVSLLATPIFVEGHQVAHYAMYHDITEQTRAQEALRQAQKIDAIGRLAGGIAHDFNNLLTVIMGYCNNLLDDLASGQARREDVEEIRNASERAAALTRQLLAFGRRQVLQPRVLNLNEVVAGIERMLRRLIGENIQIVTSLDPSLGLVKADAGQLEQVIVNLAVNARDAMPRDGRLTIETTNAYLSGDVASQLALPPGPHVLLAVTDTGCGMSAETKARLFEPFFTTKPRGQGTGLGLAMAHGIVAQSGGSIHVESEQDHGSSFRIYLPRTDEVATPDVPPAPAHTAREATALSPSPLGAR